jgi:hypothetical protein
MSKEMREQMDMNELSKIVNSYDEGVEYKGRIYATIFGPNFRDVSSSTMDGDISWNSENITLLSKINKEVLNNKGKIMKYREDEPIYTLYIELEKLGLSY